MDIFDLVILITLITFTGFFVASEYAIVKVRGSRIDQLIAEGNKKARATNQVLSNLDEYLSACQLGITMTSLGLGWIGGPIIAQFLSPIFSRLQVNVTTVSVLSVVIAFSIVTFLHVVIGELVAKQIAVQKAEKVSLMIAPTLIRFYRLMFPIIWVLNRSARLIVRLLGLKTTSEHELAHSEEELRFILSESYKSGEINQSEFKYVNNIFEFDNRIAKEIMVPRTEIVSFDGNDTIEQFLQMVREEKFTRYPVIDGDKDHILGLINVKEVMTDVFVNPILAEEKLNVYVRPIIRVIDTTPIQSLLLKMQKERIHMAILMDEYGGTSGLVTVEDIIEEIVGEIRDEFDSDEIPSIRKVKEDHYIIDSKLLVTEVNELLGLQMDDEDVDTIGGWILTENYMAKEGDIIPFQDYNFKVIEKEDHHIKYIEVSKSAKVSQPTVVEQKKSNHNKEYSVDSVI